jgi:UDPglucose--hexose-1-phosphate uridylyltransferase
MEFNLKDHTHLRKNILTGEWVMVSPHRAKRPWQGQSEKMPNDELPAYDEKCYLCPGNERANGEKNPAYESPFIFDNDFAAVIEDVPSGSVNEQDLFIAKSVKGICKVVVFSPEHNMTMPKLSKIALVELVNLWAKTFEELASKSFIKYIQIFENKGEVMGCSNPHPHGQIWSLSEIPVEIEKESTTQELYFQKNSSSLLQTYLNKELAEETRVIFENNDFAAVVPFWAVWPFETMIISKRHIKTIAEMTEEERSSLADILKEVTAKYDKLFDVSFPYSAGMHQAPVNSGDYNGWHWHMHFYPPLLRSATVKKFMVGYEMLANPQRDITPEYAAQLLKEM